MRLEIGYDIKGDPAIPVAGRVHELSRELRQVVGGGLLH